MFIIKNIIFLISLTLFSGCLSSSTQDDDNLTLPPPIIDTNDTNITEGLHIVSAVYANYNTTDTTNDKLYVYFDRYYDMENIYDNNNFVIDGNGEIGSFSYMYSYNNIFAILETNATNEGTQSKEFTVNSDKISLTQNKISDDNGNYPITNPKVIVERFNEFAHLKTGDINNYICINEDNLSNTINCEYTFIDTNDNNITKDTNVTRSDGYYANKSIGKERNISVSSTNTEIIIDNDTGLMWENNIYYSTYEKAYEYCNQLDLDSYGNWRIPNINELISITNKNTYRPAIYNEFNSTTTYSLPYFSSTINANNNDTVWAIDFYYGNDLTVDKNTSNYVRCVRNIN